MRVGHDTALSGARTATVTRTLGDLRGHTTQRAPFSWHLRNWLQYRRRDLPKLATLRAFTGLVPGVLVAESRLAGQTLKYLTIMVWIISIKLG
jgi:hypothetical protein